MSVLTLYGNSYRRNQFVNWIFYLNAIFTVVGRKRNAFAIIECNIVVDNIATNLSPIRFRQFQPSGDFVHIHVIPMEVEVIS